jgi:hypothetical protein
VRPSLRDNRPLSQHLAHQLLPNLQGLGLPSTRRLTDEDRTCAEEDNVRLVAVLLVVVGLAALAYGGFSYTREKTLIDAGPLEVTTEETNRVPLPPVLGVVAIAAGVGMLVLNRKRLTP